jgi:DNA segregation ATPase FtsK/SpoIIIE-like protein
MTHESDDTTCPRSIRWDLVAVGLFGTAAVVWISLLTHDPADDLTRVFGQPESSIHEAWYVPTAYPPNPKAQNACGAVGAIISQTLFQATGMGAYLLALLLPLAGVVCLRQQPWASPMGRSMGWTLVFVALCAIPDRFGLHPTLSVPIGGGGYLGKLINIWLDHNLAHAGGTILVLCTFLVGLLLSTEYALLRYFGYAAAGGKAAAGRLSLPALSWFQRHEETPEPYLSTRSGLPASLTMRTDLAEPTVHDADTLGSTETKRSPKAGQTDPKQPGNARGNAAHPDSDAAAIQPSQSAAAVDGPSIRIGRRTSAAVSTADLGGHSKSIGRTDLVTPKARPLSANSTSSGMTTGYQKGGSEFDELLEGHDGPGSDEPSLLDAMHASGDADDDHPVDEAPYDSEDDEDDQGDDADEEDDAGDEDDEAAFEEDVEEAAPLPPTKSSRAKATPGMVRTDASHPPQDQGPRVKNMKTRTAVDADAEREHLYSSLDDTKLPAGSEEYVLPGLDLLTEGDDFSYDEQTEEVKRKARVLELTFASFGFNIRVVEIETGPVIAQYEIELEAGLRLSKITSLSDDLAIALRVPSVRIVAPIPGKNTVGIEVPNERRQVVRMREVIEEGAAQVRKMKIPLFLGKDVSGKALSVDLASLPHLLIAGRTGTGKSVCLNSIICSILMARRPDEVRMLMIDPKMVELSGYGRLPHLMHPVVTDMRKAEAILSWAVDKMEERYALLARAGVRHITSYNQLGRDELHERLRPENDDEAEMIPDHLPFIVIVADEIADLMMTAGKEVEAHIIRLAQKSRAVGIHLILATQKPTVDVITGLIKSNLPARISFQVASRTDSRVVLDENGADKLLGNGDMLFLWPGTSTLLRGQGTYLSDDEINAIVNHCSTGEQNFVQELVQLKINADEDGAVKPGSLKKRDDLYEAAVDVVVREGRGSCSLLQRALGIGYGRAARLIDFMAEDGIVGQYNGSQAREVVISLADWDTMRSPVDEPPPKARSNKLRREDGWDEPPKAKKPSKKAKRPAMDDDEGDALVRTPDEESDEESLWDED